MMLAPITSLAIVLKAIAEKGGEPAPPRRPLLPRRLPPPLRRPRPRPLPPSDRRPPAREAGPKKEKHILLFRR